MIANYGYEDGLGQYYISIDTDQCVECDEKKCVDACEQGVYEIEEDDWGDEIVVVDERKKLMLVQLCVACKRDDAIEPCKAACPSKALKHSW